MKKRITLAIMMLALVSGITFVHPSSAVAKDNDWDDQLEMVEVMQTWIDFLAHYVSVIEDPSNAIGLAQNNLKDLYVENGEPERVIQVLNETLQFVEDQGGRNAIRFTLAEMHQEMNQPKLASDQLLKIIEENAGGSKKVNKPKSSGTSPKSVFE